MATGIILIIERWQSTAEEIALLNPDNLYRLVEHESRKLHRATSSRPLSLSLALSCFRSLLTIFIRILLSPIQL